MARLLLSPASITLEQGTSVDVTVTVDNRADDLTFRTVGGDEVRFTPRRTESVSAWAINVPSPYTSQLISSTTQQAVYRISWPL